MPRKNYPLPTETYPVTCPHCGRHMVARASIYQLMGHYKRGSGRCLECNEVFRIEYDEIENGMITSQIKNEEQDLIKGLS